MQELAANAPLWQELFCLYPLYLAELHQRGWLAPEESTELGLAKGTRIILACVPSLSERARQLLQASGHEVEAWLHTDELHDGPDWFDAWGRPTENWLATPADDVLGLDSADWRQRFCICGDLERMADETARAAGRAAGAVAIGACDPDMESAVAESFARYGIAAVRPRGIPFRASGWYRLLLELTRLAEILEQSGTRAADAPHLPANLVSSLLRHPIITEGLHLAEAAEAAHQSDLLMVTSLPASLGQMRKLAKPTLACALDTIAEWLSCLDSAQSLLSGLLQLAGEQTISGTADTLAEECNIAAQFTGQIDECCRQILDSGWAATLSPSAVLGLLMSAGTAAHPPHPEGALSLRGWLELPYAPEEELVLAGLHDGIIPERWPASPYLTPQVRSTLHLPGDESRAARDCYLLRSLYACRPGKVHALFTLLNARRDPLFPSSLFFRLTPQHHLARLVRHFFDRSRPCPATPQAAYDSTGWEYRKLTLPARGDELARLTQLTLPELGLANPMQGKTFSPSSLRQFLACPLRFWIAKLHGVRDEHISPTQRDLDARQIGDCMHAALEDFVRKFPSQTAFESRLTVRPDTPEQLAALVAEELDTIFTQAYERMHGQAELMPQQFQCASMRRRLAAYAPLHVQLWEEGWEAALDARGIPMLEYKVEWQLFGHALSFRIDRIDTRLRADGCREYRVIDYKTGHVDSCYKNHLEELPRPDARPDLHLLDAGLEPAVGPGRGNHAELRWKDLQLPLYTAWALDYFAGCAVNSAYIHLGRKANSARIIAWGDSAKDPDFFATRHVPANKAYPEEVEAEPLYDNALRWIRFGLDAMARGRVLASAEMLGWKAPKLNYDVFGDILKLEPLAGAFLRFGQR